MPLLSEASCPQGLTPILSLVFEPAVFVVMDDIGRLVWRVFSRFVGPTDEEPAAVSPPLPASAQAEVHTLPAAAE